MPRFFRSVGYAISGILHALRAERHMQVHALAAVIAICAGAWLQLERWEWVMLVVTIVIVIAAELINTAIERIVDLASPGLHPLAKAAKDTAAGAVLITAIGAVVVGLLLFVPPIWQRLLG